jgi:hypothetical protein
MSLPAKFVTATLLSGALATQVDPHSVLDVVRVAVTQHELSILRRAYLLDAIGEALPEEVDCSTLARQRLITNHRDPAFDLWGNPYQLDIGTREVRFWSFGPDGAMNTDDDIEFVLPI